jgi:hypothetical protein
VQAVAALSRAGYLSQARAVLLSLRAPPSSAVTAFVLGVSEREGAAAGVAAAEALCAAGLVPSPAGLAGLLRDAAAAAGITLAVEQDDAVSDAATLPLAASADSVAPAGLASVATAAAEPEVAAADVPAAAAAAAPEAVGHGPARSARDTLRHTVTAEATAALNALAAFSAPRAVPAAPVAVDGAPVASGMSLLRALKAIAPNLNVAEAMSADDAVVGADVVARERVAALMSGPAPVDSMPAYSRCALPVLAPLTKESVLRVAERVRRMAETAHMTQNRTLAAALSAALRCATP